MDPLVVIIGPTGVGKSALGIALAQEIGGEIISGDSVQVYKKLDIGSAKPSLLERRSVPHHLIDCLDPREPFSAAQFQKEALSLIAEIQNRGLIPIVVGGTGLYIRSLLDPYDFAQRGSEEIRAKWQNFARLHGKAALHKELEIRDQRSAEQLHPNDVVRITRALEIFELSGGQVSSDRRRFQDNIYPPLAESVVYIGLTAPRPLLYERLNQRCVGMLDQGLLAETQGLLQAGYEPDLKPLQSIGYRHAVWHLQGLVTQGEMLRLFQRDTRHFAKRQLTWFRRDPRICWYSIEREGKYILKDIVKTCMTCQSRVE